MPKQISRVELNNFTKGLITEASPLNFPDNASKEEVNFDLNKKGYRERRLGMDFEDGYQFTEYSSASVVTKTFRWDSILGYPDSDILVVQTGNKLSFFDNTLSSVSSAAPLYTVQLTSHPSSKPWQFAAVNGYLILVTGSADIIIFTYDGGSTFTQSSTRLVTRDIWGVVGTYTAETNYDKMPSALNSYDIYNLRNQSWGIPRWAHNGVYKDPIQIFKDWKDTLYPSNAMMIWDGMTVVSAAAADSTERFLPWNTIYSLSGRERAAKGYFTIDLLSRGTSRFTAYTTNNTNYPELTTYLNISSLRADTTSGGVSCIAEHAGRLFYAGFDSTVTDGDEFSPILAPYVAFSQLVTTTSQINRCYQAGDPTSRDTSDILATDGGLIRIAGADSIVGLVNIGTGLAVLATNGVWLITGNNNSGFTANEYQCNKITDKGCWCPTSIAVDNGVLLYWAVDGIYTIAKNQYGEYSAQNISKETIQTYFLNIPDDYIKYVRTGIDPYERKIRWLWFSGNPSSSTTVANELVLNIETGAFSTFQYKKIETAFCPLPVEYFDTKVYETGRSGEFRSLKYICDEYVSAAPIKRRFTIGYLKDTNFLDFKSCDGIGIDAKAYMITGTVTIGDSSIHKQIPFLFMHFFRTEKGVVEDSNGDLIPDNPSSCLCRSMWDWSNSSNSGKWSAFFQAYRPQRHYAVSGSDDPFDTGFDTVFSRSKIRGRGRAFSLYFETEAGKDCRILGWNLNVTANQAS